jgi:hypothetical protein
MGGTKPKSTFTSHCLPRTPTPIAAERVIETRVAELLNDNRHYRHVHGRGNYIQTRESNTILPSSIEGQKCQQRAPLRSPSLSGAISSCCEGRQLQPTQDTRRAAPPSEQPALFPQSRQH